MKKIRNFNLRLHFKEIRLRAKRKFDLGKIGFDDESLQKLIADAESKLQPAVIFESFGPENEDTAEFAPVPGLAHTVGLTTLGPQLGKMITEAREISPPRGDLLELVAGQAIKQSVNFVVSLLKDELEAERCELSPIEYLEAPEAIRKIYEKLEGEKILLEIKGGGLEPEYSAAFCMSWLAKRRGKKKRAKPVGGRRSAS